MRIDAHQHFWRYRPSDYPWITDGMDALKRDWLPRDLHPLLKRHGIDACIAVQARATEAETDFLLDLAAAHDWIAAVVGWVDLTAGDLEARLARWDGKAKLAGFRHPIQDEADVAGFLRNPRLRSGVALLQRQQRVYELLVHAHQLEAAADFSAAAGGHHLVLDHLGKPAIRERGHDEWRRRLRPFKNLSHVVCKLSGLVTEAVSDRGRYDEGEIMRYLETALELFGPRRLMFGSDWPVCLLAAPYDAVYRLMEILAEQLSTDERSDVFGGTAARCYALDLRAGERNDRSAG
ncbi:MAG TPA: amidohydrolase family protein [Steroidobacteraceae bacterium]|nr:amidohydrolase family protein [Steroidobacteraceae bacterium]